VAPPSVAQAAPPSAAPPSEPAERGRHHKAPRTVAHLDAPPAAEPPRPVPSPPAPPSAAPAPPTAAALAAQVRPAPPPPKPSAPARLDVADLRISGGIPRNDVMQAVGRTLDLVRHCIAEHGGLPAGDHADVSLTIDDQGFFVDVRGSGGVLGECGRQGLHAGKLRSQPDTGDVKVTVSLRMVEP
jgi:hypothetical protein